MSSGLTFKQDQEILSSLKRLDSIFRKQYLHYGGFCETCGEGKVPFANGDTEMFGLCKCKEKGQSNEK